MMNYRKEEIKQGITFHKVYTNKFKTNLFAVFLTTKLDRESVTKNALLTAVLRRGTKDMPTQDIISKNLENMYGASFDCGVEKTGDNHVMKFYLESINDEFLPEKQNLTKDCIDILLNIVFNPYVENGKFKDEYVMGEKENIKQIIQGKIDNKAKYAFDRCIEEMYKNEPYGLYKYGYIEDLDNIDSENLYKYYFDLLKNVKIDIFASGELDDTVVDEIRENSIIKNLDERNPEFNINGKNNVKNIIDEPRVINESMQIAQGKLVIGLDILDCDEESKYKASVYNIILGGSANSKMFQNVREKASLAYTAGSVYLRQKDNIFIKCGIDILNYDKALEIIKEQLKQMENGDFSQEDIDNSKIIISASVAGIPESQDSEINYYFAQELTGEFVAMEEYVDKVNKVQKEDIVDVAKRMQINMVYFLRD